MAENTMRLTLKAHEKMFLNGAVIRFDRKTKIEILNNAHFLLEAHVLQADETDTPLKQLYYAAQIMLMDPVGSKQAATLFRDMLVRLINTTSNKTILSGLHDCSTLAEQERIFDILKLLRGLFPIEAKILKKSTIKHIERFPKSGNRFLDKKRGENKNLEQLTEPSEVKTALVSACENP